MWGLPIQKTASEIRKFLKNTRAKVENDREPAYSKQN